MQPNKSLLFQVDTASPKAFENEVIEDLQRSGSIKDTAQRTSLKWDTCKQIHERVSKKKHAFLPW